MELELADRIYFTHSRIHLQKRSQKTHRSCSRTTFDIDASSNERTKERERKILWSMRKSAREDCRKPVKRNATASVDGINLPGRGIPNISRPQMISFIKILHMHLSHAFGVFGDITYLSQTRLPYSSHFWHCTSDIAI